MISTKKSLATFVTVWIVSSVLVIAIITLIASLYISNEHKRNNKQMSEQLQYLVEVQSLSNSLNKLVSDFRGYLAFGRQEFLDATMKEKLSFDNELGEYSRKQTPDDYKDLLLRDNMYTQENMYSVEAIERLWAQYSQLIEQAIVLKQKDEQDEANQLSKEETTPVINEIFRQFNMITERQNDNVDQIMNENRLFNRLLYYLLFGFSAGLALLGFFLVMFMKRSLIAPINKLEQHVQLISQGDYIVIPSSGRLDEIGQLEIGINEMSRLLKLRLEAIEMSRVEVTEQRDELEAQNEEIMAQQEEQESTLLIIRQREYLIRQIIESIYEGLLLCDHNGHIILANDRISSMLELDIREGIQVDELLIHIDQGSDSSNLMFLINDIRANLPSLQVSNHIQFNYKSKNGENLYFDLYMKTITKLQDNHNGYLFVFRDRTEEEKVNEMKNEFVSVVSHELRTPLSSILGFVEILLQREVAPDKQKKYLETVFKEAKRLSNLIVDFLDIQRMEAGKQQYHLSPLSLIELMQELADRYNSSSTHRIHLEWMDDPNQFIVSGDYDRLFQAFDNLLSNAVKYSPGNNRIDVIMNSDGNLIRVHIKDYGLGIPESSRNKLFTKFYRVDNSDRRKIGGTGLGLVIVKEIIGEHNGDINYESVLSEGSIFTVTLNRVVNGSDAK